MASEGGNKEKMRKCREWISLHFLMISPFPHYLSISSSFSHSLSIFSQPGCQADTICATLYCTIPIFPDTQLVTPASIPRSSQIPPQRTLWYLLLSEGVLRTVISKYNFSFCTNSSFSNVRWLLCRKMHKYNNSNNSNQVNCLPF